MKAILNAADKFTQYALAAVLTLFAVVCMFSSCKVETGQAAPTEATTDATSEISVLNLGTFRITPYCPCKICCGSSADGITATGTKATAGRTISVDEDVIPFGSEVIINGHTYIAEDNAVNVITGREISIFFDTHEEAEAFGVQYANVTLILNGGDTE